MSQPEMPVEPRTSGKAVASLVLGIMSFCLWILTGIPAIILGIMGVMDTNRRPQEVRGQGFAIAGIVTGALGCVSTAPILIALLLPAIQAARESARRAQSSSYLKQQSFGMLAFASTNQRYPDAADASGGAPMSWRTQILPYLEQDALYQQYDRSQPWDSPTNQAVADTVIREFQNPNLGADLTQTNYLVLRGEQTMFPPGRSLPSGALRDGESNTIMIVEADADRAVPWSKPQDLQYDPNNPFDGLGGLRYGTLVVVYADGHAQNIDVDEISPEVFKALVTPAGNESVYFD